jgi:hypothetical protein
VLSNISDTSDIPQRLFVGQFTRWTIQLEILDAFLYNIPYRKNWRIYTDDTDILAEDQMNTETWSELEIAKDLTTKPEETEKLPVWFKK